jgi:enoyl-CoA hydratase/carnithine racemase
MKYQCIETDLRDGILILRHAREEKLNARSAQMYTEIMAVLAGASINDDVVAVMLTAKGKFFSAGMDFQDNPKLAYEILESDGPDVVAVKKSLPNRDADDVRTWLAVRFIESFINFDKPLIGAVNGPAIGEGFSSLLHCDMVYAADGVYFWAPFARAGVAPEFCSTILMRQRLGRTLASAAMYLGKRISVKEAQAAGFVLEVFDSGEGFERSVLDRLQQGLALSGPPELRAQTLQSYRRLVYPASERALLLQQCHDEFDLIRQRGQSGATQEVQRYYQAQLPAAKP